MVLIRAGIFIAIELSNAAALFHTEEVFACADTRFLIKIQVGGLVDIVTELGELRCALKSVDNSFNKCPEIQEIHF